MRLCARLTGDIEAAEDLAQETLYEAWRHIHRLHTPAGREQWLSAIARHVCRRWARRRGQELTYVVQADHATVQPNGQPDERGAPDLDLELILERHELAELLDRALALLPPETRTILVAHYVDDLPQAEIAARLGVSASLVKARVHRGKRLLRRALTTHFLRDAAAYGLVDVGDPQETRIWCPYCGQSHLSGVFRGGIFRLTCPHCAVIHERGSTVAQCWTEHPIMAPVLQSVTGYKPALSRLMGWADAYYRRGLRERRVPCLDCGRLTPLHAGLPLDAPPLRRAASAVHVRCAACGAGYGEILTALALYTPDGQRFWRAHPRIRMIPERAVEAEGRAALVTSFESVSGQGRLDVVSVCETLELMGIHQVPH